MHSVKEYLKRQSTEVLEIVLRSHLEGTEVLDEETVELVEQLLRQREDEK